MEGQPFTINNASNPSAPIWRELSKTAQNDYNYTKKSIWKKSLTE